MSLIYTVNCGLSHQWILRLLQYTTIESNWIILGLNALKVAHPVLQLVGTCIQSVSVEFDD